jgi:hypothetical protein
LRIPPECRWRCHEPPPLLGATSHCSNGRTAPGMAALDPARVTMPSMGSWTLNMIADGSRK